MFGNMFTSATSSSATYKEITDMKKFEAIIEEKLSELNTFSKKPMNLVLFEYALKHLMRISRVLMQPQSHALLLGFGGAGKRSLTRLAAYLNGFEMFEVPISKQYGLREWYEDLKEFLRKIAFTEAGKILFLSDPQVTKLNTIKSTKN